MDVRLRNQAEAHSLTQLGVELEEHDRNTYVVQPCRCLQENNQCSIYDQRPSLCARFECGVLKAFMADELKEHDCADLVEQAHQKIEVVRSLLEKLGNKDGDVPLFLRSEEVLAQAWDLSAPEAQTGLRDQLYQASADLSGFLESHFLSTHEPTEDLDPSLDASDPTPPQV